MKYKYLFIMEDGGLIKAETFSSEDALAVLEGIMDIIRVEDMKQLVDFTEEGPVWGDISSV